MHTDYDDPIPPPPPGPHLRSDFIPKIEIPVQKNDIDSVDSGGLLNYLHYIGITYDSLKAEIKDLPKIRSKNNHYLEFFKYHMGLKCNVEFHFQFYSKRVNSIKIYFWGTEKKLAVQLYEKLTKYYVSQFGCSRVQGKPAAEFEKYPERFSVDYFHAWWNDYYGIQLKRLEFDSHTNLYIDLYTNLL